MNQYFLALTFDMLIGHVVYDRAYWTYKSICDRCTSYTIVSIQVDLRAAENVPLYNQGDAIHDRELGLIFK
jgi:hypothetical protein